MNAVRNTAMVSIATVLVVLVGLLLFGHGPVWASVLLVVALAAAVITAIVLVATRRPSRPAPLLPPQETSFAVMAEPPLPPPPVEHRRERIDSVLLPSAREDYNFSFSAQVLWSPVQAMADTSTINMSAWAIDAILKRARELTSDRDPSHSSLVSHELGRALGEMREDITGIVRAMAEDVKLFLPNHDQERLDKLAAVRKQEDIWEHERRYEQSKREYLHGDVLKNPGSAVVWWLTRNDDQVEKTVKDIGILAQLSRAANNIDLPEPFRPVANLADSDASQSLSNEKSAADHFDDFLGAMDLTENDPQRALFAHQVADFVAKHGRPEVAGEMMHRFDAAQSPEDSWEPNDEG